MTFNENENVNKCPINDPSDAPSKPAENPAYNGAQYYAPQTGSAYAPAHAARKKTSPFIVILAVFLTVVIAAGGIFGYVITRRGENNNIDDTLSKGGETVTINDSVLGEIEIQTVEGASINTYDENGLVREDNGYYSYYIDGKKTSEMGVDLSEYQTDIDFDAVKASGVDFVMLRIGGRYYSENGGLYSDSAFSRYAAAAKAAGLKVGAYFFSQAASVEDAVEEAKFSLALLGDIRLDYPIAFDWEIIENDSARTDSVTGDMLTLIAAAFCDTIRESGNEAIVYASTSLMLQSYDFETMKDYDFWLADYREFPNSEKMYYNFTMWQYTTEGYVDGINSPVDLNLCLKAY